jgi:hypothetical protein
MSNDIQNHNKLLECIKDDVLVFLYDKLWSYEKFMTELAKCLTSANIATKSLDLVGWVFHGFNIEKPDSETKAKIIFNIVSDYEIILNDKSNLTQYQHLVDFILFVKKYMNTSRFDLISCCLLGNPYFEHTHKLLSDTTGLNFASSDDLTGNIKGGGDWILESDDVNLIGTYFKPDTEEILGDVSVSLAMNTSLCS